MTEEQEVVESGQEVQEEQEQPTPEAPSVPSGVQQASAPSLDADEIVAKVVEQLGPEIDKRFQSAKDRRFADVEKISSYLQASGGNVDEAVKQMKIDEILEREAEPVSGVPGRDEQNKVAMEAISAQYLTDAGIDFNDPGYLALVASYGWINSAEAWEPLVRAFAETKKTKAAKQEGVTEAAAIGEPGATISESEDEDELTAELMRLQNPQPGEPGLTNPDNIKRRKEIAAKLRQVAPRADVPSIRVRSVGK